MISVIMASYLGEYPNRASNPEKKFVRAVKSFLSQSYKDKELIIVSDGCDITEKLYNIYFSNEDSIRFIKIEKQPIYSGECRNAGLRIARGEFISYLDNDDVLGKKHLEIIINEFTDDVDIVYYNDFLVRSSDFKSLFRRINNLSYGHIGTSSFTHRNINWLRWTTGYGHDHTFVISGIINGLKHKKIKETPQYLVCHYGSGENKGDF